MKGSVGILIDGPLLKLRNSERVGRDGYCCHMKKRRDRKKHTHKKKQFANGRRK